MKLSVFVSVLIGLSTQDKLQCPLLDCTPYDNKVEFLQEPTNLCFQHDKKQPTEKFISNSCDAYEKFSNSPMVCEFDLTGGEFAWVDERY
jgi:hypothetical protein